MNGPHVGAGKVVGLGDFIDLKIRYSAVERQAAQVAIMEERRIMRKQVEERRIMRKQVVWGFLTLVLLSGGMAYWRLTAEPPALMDDTAVVAIPATSPKSDPKKESEEEKERRKLLGVWHDDSQDNRKMTMTLIKDGTGTMLVELSGWQAALYASKLRFDMKWSLNGKKLFMKTMGGEPADKVNLVLNMAGNTGEDTILELTDDRLLLLNKDGKTKYNWRRAKKDEGSK